MSWQQHNEEENKMMRATARHNMQTSQDGADRADQLMARYVADGMSEKYLQDFQPLQHVHDPQPMQYPQNLQPLQYIHDPQQAEQHGQAGQWDGVDPLSQHTQAQLARQAPAAQATAAPEAYQTHGTEQLGKRKQTHEDDSSDVKENFAAGEMDGDIATEGREYSPSPDDDEFLPTRAAMVANARTKKQKLDTTAATTAHAPATAHAPTTALAPTTTLTGINGKQAKASRQRNGRNGYHTDLATAIEVSARLPPCEIGAVELATFLPNHLQWPEAGVRFLSNGWTANDIAKAQLHARGRYNPESISKRRAALRHTLPDDCKLFFNNMYFLPSKNKTNLTPVTSYNASGYAPRRNVIDALSDGTLLELANGVVKLSTGQPERTRAS